MVRIYNQIPLGHRKEWNNAICSNMGGHVAARHYHTKWNKPVREKQMSYDITYMCNLKNLYK